MSITLKIKKIVWKQTHLHLFLGCISENIIYIFYHKRSTVISAQMGGGKNHFNRISVWA